MQQDSWKEFGGRTISDRGFDDKAAPKSVGGIPSSSAPSSDGVDVSLIRWMLAMSPRERLLATQAAARSIRTLILLKEEFGRKKDIAMLPVLRRTLRAQAGK